MKKYKGDIEKIIKFGLVRIYKTDIMEIIETIKTEYEIKELIIGDNLIEDVNEIESLNGKEFKDFYLESNPKDEQDKSFLIIHFGKDFAGLKISNNEDALLVGISKKVTDIIEKNESYKIITAHNFTLNVFLYSLIIIMLIFIYEIAFIPYAIDYKILMSLFFIPYFTLVVPFINTINNKRSRIFLFDKENESFMKRHGKRIWQIALVVLGVILTLLGEYIFKKLNL